MWPFKRSEAKIEKRSSMSGFTAELMSARESYISGRRGIAELTATAQSCVSLWENGFALADVVGIDLLDRRTMAMIGRSLALRGECVFLIRDDALVPCSDWDLRTIDGRPSAYRLSISEAGGGTTRTALAREVLHFRIGADVATPWAGQAPLKRAQLTSGLLHVVESALAEMYEEAPLGSLVLPFPEARDVDLEQLGRGFRGRRGRVMLRESVNVAAAGGPVPNSDWRPADVTPDISKAMTEETWRAARGSICSVFGVLPALLDPATTGPAVRESQRHLAQWTLQPIAMLLAQEASEKLGGDVSIDVIAPSHSYDSGARARAFSTIVTALAEAKGAGLDAGEVSAALRLLFGIEKITDA